MSSQHVCAGALLQCSFGVVPATLNVLPVNRVMAGGKPAANLMDNQPFVNIPPFGMCNSIANPAVAAATAAAMGVLTPMPCTPVTVAPWIPGGAPTVMLGSAPALNANGTLMCMWGGVIKVAFPGQMTVMVP